MKHTITEAQAKNQANLLAAYLETISRKVSHGNALEAVAAMYGVKSWNVLSAQLEGSTAESSMDSSVSATPKDRFSVFKGVSLHSQPLVIEAEVHTDDYRREVNFNAAPWFAQASDTKILALADIGWRGDRAADDVAEYIERKASNPEVSELFAYLDGRADDDIGFEVVVNEENALQYCRAFRYPLFVKLMLIAQFGNLEDAESVGGLSVVEYTQDSGRFFGNLVWQERTVGPFRSSDEAYAALGKELEDEFWASANGEVPVSEFRDWSISREVLDIRPDSGVLEERAPREPAQAKPGPGNLVATEKSADSDKVLGRLDEVGHTGAVLVLKDGDASLSHAALRHITQDGTFYVKFAVPVGLSDLIDEDIEFLNDKVSEALTGAYDLVDLSYERYTFPNEGSLIDTKSVILILVTAGWEPSEGFEGLDEDEGDD